MRVLFVLCLAIFAAVVSVSALRAETSGFSAVIDELPLMAGLEEIGDGVEFSTPNGRLAEIITEGSVSRAEVVKFYAQTLPQLGWVAQADDTFMREDESLMLAFEQMGKTLRVRFTLTPLAAAQKKAPNK